MNATRSIDPDASFYHKDLGFDSIDFLELSVIISMKYGFQMKSDDLDITTMFFSLPPGAGWHYLTMPHPIAAMLRGGLVFSVLILAFSLTFFILLHTRIVWVQSAKFTAILGKRQDCRFEFAQRSDGAVRFLCEARRRTVSSGFFDIDNTAP